MCELDNDDNNDDDETEFFEKEEEEEENSQVAKYQTSIRIFQQSYSKLL